MNAIQDDIRDAVDKELISANEHFPLFSSMHEAIAVIMEERDESEDELKSLTTSIRFAWLCIKENRDTQALGHISRAAFNAERLAIEACQLAAMCHKAAQSAALWNDGGKTK